ncbi:hypothetical protein FACS189449_06810 [Alphaproteobacteria bacterium]|nr:hypothetical protein FACS189449_06810 [Alphaproteobacteria bacterium]
MALVSWTLCDIQASKKKTLTTESSSSTVVSVPEGEVRQVDSDLCAIQQTVGDPNGIPFETVKSILERTLPLARLFKADVAIAKFVSVYPSAANVNPSNATIVARALETVLPHILVAASGGALSSPHKSPGGDCARHPYYDYLDNFRYSPTLEDYNKCKRWVYGDCNIVEDLLYNGLLNKARSTGLPVDFDACLKVYREKDPDASEDHARFMVKLDITDCT